MNKEHLFQLGAIFATLALIETAFTRNIRKEIGANQKWTCQGIDGEPCNLGLGGMPARYQDGFMIQVRHFDHDRRNPDYNNPNNGACTCVLHHAVDHLLKGEKWEAQQILNMGIYTWDHLKKTGISQVVLSVDQLLEEYERTRL